MSNADKDGTIPIDPERRVATGPGQTEASSFDPRRLDFGHHIGRTIEELAQLDPDYLAWLERHPAGARYRGEIHRIMNGSGVRRY
ncbi:MAG: hypothetical protein ABI534_05250 [Chloroflexota bacterium]